MKIPAASLRAGKDDFHVVPDQTMARLDRNTAALATQLAIGQESEKSGCAIPRKKRGRGGTRPYPPRIPTLRRGKLAGINPDAAKFPQRFYRAVSR